MPGTVANPVRLQNVFRRITEVHWRTDRFIAFTIQVKRTNTNTPGDWLACADPDDPDHFPPVPVGWDVTIIETFYTESSQVEYDGTGYSNFKVLRNGAWVDISATLTGLPSDLPQTFTYGAEAIPGPSNGYSFNWPVGRWEDATGADITYTRNGETLPIVTPTGSLTFKSDLSTVFEIVGNSWVDPMGCWDLRTYGYAGPLNRAGQRTSTFDVVHSSIGFSLSGMSVSYNGKTYLPVGFRYEPSGAVFPFFTPDSAGVLHVLCDREAASG